MKNECLGVFLLMVVSCCIVERFFPIRRRTRQSGVSHSISDHLGRDSQTQKFLVQQFLLYYNSLIK